jgi:hypothetical protein
MLPLTRNCHAHAYGHSAGAVPPYHGVNITHARQGHALAARGGLAGGAVVLNMPPGMWGNTGYGYLGMDPSDPGSWPRPFVPTTGMLSRPVSQVEYGRTGPR